MILLLNPQYFFILGNPFYSLSHIFVLEIIDDKINKIKWSCLHNLRKLKYVNNEIPNSLRWSLSCLGFSRIKTKMIVCEVSVVLTFSRCNIPNFQFGMLYIRSSMHIIFYFCILVDPRNSTQLNDPRRELGISLFSYLSFLKFWE